MASELQNFLVRSTQKACDDLIAAIERLPEDKRTWRPEGKGRSALNQAAECAILNGSTADVINARSWAIDFDMAGFEGAKQQLEGDWSALKSLLLQNTSRATAAIADVPDALINKELETPFGPMMLSQIMSYPYWNMCYHEGQTTYIETIL
jgi:hypothetical protein